MYLIFRCQLGDGLYPLDRLHRHLGLEFACDYPSFLSHLYASFPTIFGTQFPLKPVVLKLGVSATNVVSDDRLLIYMVREGSIPLNLSTS